MDSDTRELLASITARLDSISMTMHESARESAKLKRAATLLRTGERPTVVLATLGPDYRWHHEPRHASSR